MDTQAKGAFIGLDINTSQGDINKGILEGITYEMMINLERLDSIGITVNEIKCLKHKIRILNNKNRI